MSLLKYSEYISEKVMYELLLESKLVFSKNFQKILSKMKDNKIALELKNLDRKNVDGIKQNYIDITDEKDKVSFIPDRKAQEFTNDDKPDQWEVIQSDRYLTHSDTNDRVFSALGYDKTKNEVWNPNVGSLGQIEKEYTSNSGRTYVLYREGERVGVLNKQALQLVNTEDPKVWTSNRNPMNVGRLIRAILKTAEVEFTTKDIEDFVNKYKAIYDFSQDKLKQFDIVKGKVIAHWYHTDNYVDGGGSLNNSCMAEVDEEYFDIYCYNNAVSLLILYSDDGTMGSDGKYTATEIKGRALLWDCEIDGTPATFMDRVYTTSDSDVELFKEYAEKNGWWYKKGQSMYPDDNLTDGSTTKRATIIAKLNESEWGYYPYFDTLCYFSTTRNIITNNDSIDGINRMGRDTEGSVEYIGDDEDDDDY